MRLTRLVVPLFCLATLSACGAATTPSRMCTGLDPFIIGPSGATDAPAAQAAGSGQGGVARAVAGVFAAGPPAAFGEVAAPPVNYLALSTGGQYAAFGAGFMAGWSKNTAYPRPEFDIVTGGSAGATVAPAAFAGKAFDGLLPFAQETDTAGLARQRPLIALLGANSLYDVSGLKRTVDRSNTPDLRAAIAAGAERRALLVGAVNLNTSSMEVFDLARYAARDDAEPGCISETVLASAAIPALFPPRHINERYYADAGLREHIFFRGIEESRRRSGSPRTVNAYMIVNGDLKLAPEAVDENLIDLSFRAFSIVTDQGLRQSILNALDVAESRSWRLRAVTARDVDLTACEGAGDGKTGLFDGCITRTLYAEGYRMGRSITASGWLDEGELRRLAGQLQ